MLLLVLKGYRILARRYRTTVGEIDIVARRRHTLAIVEVKLRRDFETGAHAVSTMQRQRIARAASLFAAGRKDCDGCDVRFDVMLVAPWRLPRHVTDGWPAT